MSAHLDEAVNDAILATATFTVLAEAFTTQLQAPPPSSLSKYREDTLAVSIPLVEAAAMLADAVTTAVQLLEDRIVALEAHNHDTAYSPIGHTH